MEITVRINIHHFFFFLGVCVYMGNMVIIGGHVGGRVVCVEGHGGGWEGHVVGEGEGHVGGRGGTSRTIRVQGREKCYC